MRHIILLALLLQAPLVLAAGKSPVLLPADKIAGLKQKPCTFFHVWATWCTICVQELPEVIKVLNGLKALTPVVIDVSSPFVQDQFSKKWAQTLKASFPIYLKPAGRDDLYLNSIDRDWSGALPYSVLFDKGKRKKVWLGALDLASFKGEIATLCR